MSAHEPPAATSHAAPAPRAADSAAVEPHSAPPADDAPRYFAWTDRWDPAKWEMPENPTPLQRVLAGVALVIVLVMTIYVPLRVLKIL